MDKLSKLRKRQADAIAIYNNIEWNLGGLIGMAVIIANPKLLHRIYSPSPHRGAERG